MTPLVSFEENVFATLHFLQNLRMGPLGCSVTSNLAGKAFQGQTHKLTESILKLRRKRSVMNVTTGVCPLAIHDILSTEPI